MIDDSLKLVPGGELLKDKKIDMMVPCDNENKKLLISDIMMPGSDGYELCAALKKDIKTSHVPIVLLTAKASEENIIRGLETGADDYVTKPFSTKLLMVRIKNLIDLRRHFQLTLYREMTQQPVKMSISRMDREFIKELQDMIEKNLSDPDFNVD